MKKLSFLLAILTLCCLILPACSAGQTAEDLSQAFVAYLSSQNFEAAHSCLWDKGDSKVSIEDYVSNYQYVINALHVNKIEIADRKVTVEGDAIYLSFALSYVAEKFTLEQDVRTRIIKRGRALLYSIFPGYDSAGICQGQQAFHPHHRG